MNHLETLVIAYQQQQEMLRRAYDQEPPYEDTPARERWKVTMTELREDFGKAHLELSLALYPVPDAPPVTTTQEAL